MHTARIFQASMLELGSKTLSFAVSPAPFTKKTSVPTSKGNYFTGPDLFSKKTDKHLDLEWECHKPVAVTLIKVRINIIRSKLSVEYIVC